MKILVISAHPDDEVLGCGGTLLKHKKAGDKIDWIIASKGLEKDWSKEILAKRPKEIVAVIKKLGVSEVYQLEFPAARLDSVPQFELIDSLRLAIKKSAPAIVYLVHSGDVHSDHRIVYQCSMAVLKPMHMAKFGVKRVLSYETISSTDQSPPLKEFAFCPNVFSDISAFLDLKLELMKLYSSQIQNGSMPRSIDTIRALARMRGATIDVDYAEAFLLVAEQC